MPREPIQVRHPPHTRRARQHARELARERTAGRRRALLALALAPPALLALARPSLLLVAAASVALGVALRWAALRLLPRDTSEAGSSRAPRRRGARTGAGPAGVLVLALVVTAIALAGVLLARTGPGTSDGWLEGPWRGTPVHAALMAVASWPPLRWIVFAVGLLFAGTIRRALFARRTRTVAVGAPREPADPSGTDDRPSPPSTSCPR